MRIRLLSDLHLEFGDWTPPKVAADLVIFAGDVNLKLVGVPWILKHFSHTPVLYVLGNHEYYGEKIPTLQDKIRKLCAGTNVQLLENDHVEIGGVRFFGATLWTDMCLFGDPVLGSAAALEMTDFKKIRVAPTWKKLSPAKVRQFHAQTLSTLRSFLSQRHASSVIITHHAPSPRSLPDQEKESPISCAYASQLEPLIVEFQPQLWVHGHIHRAVDYRIGNTHIVSNPKGYPDEAETHFSPELVIDTPTLNRRPTLEEAPRSTGHLA